MKRYELRVKFYARSVDDETFHYVMDHMRHGHFEYSYGRNINNQFDTMEFVFRGLSEQGVETTKEWWRALNLEGGNFTTVETYG
ncbi:hypothetical protein PHIN3_266 [Sinorhizobium phage phiN3]|uniref:Uncharacterized protein n=1 Tax=Sinorhizobium phage phiN3 TaxID=1647405 RepID=A0A0F6YR43_9CAUD|nr:hypothetical protein AVT40_gp267 [Sinorhizobium phage phiN3]AKF13529.1 hypothetical protein PHIN3_266 [Sinorhizobium phage phiN3]